MYRCVIASSAGVLLFVQHMVITMAKDEETVTWVAALCVRYTLSMCKHVHVHMASSFTDACVRYTL